MMFSLGRKSSRYMFFEMLPGLITGVLVFIFILLMSQALRLTEFVLVHGISFEVISQIVIYLSVSFLPVILPMALLFAVLMTYLRMSNDSEMVALKAVGYSQLQLTWPAILLSLIVAGISAQTSFRLAPWGNRQFELLITKLSQTKAAAVIKEGTFSEGFFDLVVYANKVNTISGVIEKVFIYDARSDDVPLTIIAKGGQIIQDPKNPNQSVTLQLSNGDIHRKTDTHTKIHFGQFQVKLSDPVVEEHRAKTPPSMTMEELTEQLQTGSLTEILRRSLSIEFHKRWAIAVACLIFGLLGATLGTQIDRRSQKSGGFVLSVGLIVVYWIVYVACEGWARAEGPIIVTLWLPDFIFLLIAGFRVKALRD
jgi:lipopolysaccharide export system permease protein